MLGSSNTDLVLRTPRLPAPGETVLGTEFLQAAGGKGANQAVAAARAGAFTSFLGAFGADAFGDAGRAALLSEGIDLSGSIRVEDRPGGLALIFVDDAGRNIIGVHAGANAELTPEHVRATPDSLWLGAGEGGSAAQPGVFVAQLETPLETVREGLRRARRSGMTTILNPAPASPETLSAAIHGEADILIPNETEAAALTGAPIEDESSARRAATALLAEAPVVVLTLGARGSLVATSRAMGLVPARSVAAIDTVAAGDAFVGAFACRLAESRSNGSPANGSEDPLADLASARAFETLFEAARWATRAAAIAVTRRGAQPSIPTRNEIEAFPA